MRWDFYHSVENRGVQPLFEHLWAGLDWNRGVVNQTESRGIKPNQSDQSKTRVFLTEAPRVDTRGGLWRVREIQVIKAKNEG